MAAAPITLEVLPAGYGDSLLVSCPVGRRTWRMLIDTGPDECWPTLKARLAQIPKNTKGQRVIDLLVVSHIDHDHIGGVAQLLADRELGLSFADVWFNAPSLRRNKAVAEGQQLADVLGAGDPKLPWNHAFQGELCVTGPGTQLSRDLPTKRGLPKLTVLSPTAGTLNNLFKSWERELQKLHLRTREPLQAQAKPLEELDLAALASKVTAVDQSAPNGSAIAILLEHRGASVLLGADAFPTVLTSALKDLALARKTPKGLKVDAFKLSHHSSKANTTLDLLKAGRPTTMWSAPMGRFLGIRMTRRWPGSSRLVGDGRRCGSTTPPTRRGGGLSLECSRSMAIWLCFRTRAAPESR